LNLFDLTTLQLLLIPLEMTYPICYELTVCAAM